MKLSNIIRNIAKRPLNDYQKFVKKEIKDGDYELKKPEDFKNIGDIMKDVGKKWQKDKKKSSGKYTSLLEKMKMRQDPDNINSEYLRVQLGDNNLKVVIEKDGDKYETEVYQLQDGQWVSIEENYYDTFEEANHKFEEIVKEF